VSLIRWKDEHRGRALDEHPGAYEARVPSLRAMSGTRVCRRVIINQTRVDAAAMEPRAAVPKYPAVWFTLCRIARMWT